LPETYVKVFRALRPFSFFIAYLLESVFWISAVSFHVGSAGFQQFMHDYGLALNRLFFFLYVIQAIFQIAGAVKPLLKSTLEYAAGLDTRIASEDAIVQRLTHLPADWLEDRRKRLELEIRMNEKAGILATAVSVIVAIGEGFGHKATPDESVAQTQKTSTANLHTTTTKTTAALPPQVLIYSFLVGLLFGAMILLPITKNLQRLVHVLKRARKEHDRVTSLTKGYWL